MNRDRINLTCGLAVALIAATFLAYQPAWHGEFLWDDDAHFLNNPVLKPGGLATVWKPGGYLNYWPLTYTGYWLQFTLWGLNPLGYHLVNIGLHALIALGVWRVLRVLNLPGAPLAAALFALHPVNVESVAWIAQLKGLLALLLTVGAVWCYLEHDRRGGTWRYGAAVGLFLLSTLAKGAAVTLPVVLLMCVWWQRGRLTGRDVARVIPFLVIGGAMTGMEIWMQHGVAGTEVVRADGWLSRTAVAGCAVWFYFSKVLWPVNLCFVYPRWNLADLAPIDFLPSLALVALLGLAWRARARWGRAVVMTGVCYTALLLPALGFVNIYFMKYSLVADHYQYTAMIVPCAAIAAGCARWGRRLRAPWRQLLGVALLTALATLTWRQTRIYRNGIALWQDTLARNPGCWMAHNNLGSLLSQPGQTAAAIAHYEQALRLNPDYADAHYNLGLELGKAGRLPQAVTHLQQAIRLKPESAPAYSNLGYALQMLGHIDDAVRHYQTALELDPHLAEAHCNWGTALAKQGQLAAAAERFRTAVRLNPAHQIARDNLRLIEAALRQQSGAPARPPVSP